MPEWLHNRAEHLLAKNPSMNKSQAFAIATQQSHKMGKSPKGYGTKKGKKEARQKYDKPRKEYVRGANPGKLDSPKLAEVGLEEGLAAGGGALAGVGLGVLGAKFKGGRQAARVAKLLKPAGPHVTIGAKARGQWASELPKLDPASQKAIMENPLVAQGGMAPEMALMHIRDSMKPGEKIVDFLAKQRTPQVTSKIGSALPEFFDELMSIQKVAAEHKDLTPGGKADKKQLKDFPKDQIAMGQKIEMEHTNDPALAREISMDHLDEFKDYYTRLRKMEDEAKKAKGETEKKATPGSDSGCSEPGRRLGQKGLVPRKFRNRLNGQAEQEKKAMTEKEKGEGPGRDTTAKDVQAISAYMKKRPKGEEDEEFHNFAEGRGVNVHEAEEAVYDMLKEKKASAFFNELTKISISQSDNPYMLDQIGEGKIRPKRAAAPDPKFRVKQAMFPTSPTPMGSSGMDSQKRLTKSQKVGTPAAPKPPKPKGMPKVGFATSGFSGPLSMGGFPQASGQAARVNPPTHVMDPNIKTAGPPSEKKGVKEAAARMAKWAAIPLTPAGRLASSRKEGKPKTTGFSGPSIAGVAKPVGFSNVVPGAGKNRI